MNKTISKTDAKQLLKAEGLKLSDYAAYLDIKPQSLSARWTTGQLHIVDTLAVQHFAQQHSTDDTAALIRQAVDSQDKTVLSLLVALKTALDSKVVVDSAD